MGSPMTKWVGVLARGGVVHNDTEEQAISWAIDVVGEQPLSQLRQWSREQDSRVVDRERFAAIQALIYMVNADRAVDMAERALLEEVIGASDLSEADQAQLFDGISDPPSLEGLSGRLTHPTLRELMLALAWELAASDGTVMLAERDFHSGLAKHLGISEERVGELRQRAIELTTPS